MAGSRKFSQNSCYTLRGKYATTDFVVWSCPSSQHDFLFAKMSELTKDMSSACDQIVERFIRHNECSNQNPSGISQIVLYKLLDEGWGHDGYFKWLINLRLEYTRRRNCLLGACEDFLPREVITWNPPAAGMFVRDLVSFLFLED